MFEKPNLLIIMSDQHAADTIGGMRHPAVQTPALDQLMANGISFRNAYCGYYVYPVAGKFYARPVDA